MKAHPEVVTVSRSREARYVVLAATLSMTFALVVAIAGCGGAKLGAGAGNSPTDVAQVTLGRYNFGPTSNILNHPYWSADATTPTWIFPGWGACAGWQITAAFSDGGLVSRVKTLRLLIATPVGTGQRKEYSWIAQDTRGNIHSLQYQELDDGSGHSSPPQKQGVAAGLRPRFVLPKASVLARGYTWYDYSDPGNPDGRTTRHRILSMDASVRGRSGLMREEQIADGNGDGVFDPRWRGLDCRRDFYWGPDGYGLYNMTVQMNPAGGFARG